MISPDQYLLIVIDNIKLGKRRMLGAPEEAFSIKCDKYLDVNLQAEESLT